MNVFKIILTITISIGLNFTLSSSAQDKKTPCPYQGVASPSEDNRIIYNNQLNLSFFIPQNYKAIKYDQSSIAHIIDPASYNYQECIDRIGIENIPELKNWYDGSLYPSINIKVATIKTQISLHLHKDKEENKKQFLYGVIRELYESPNMDYIGFTTINQQPALIYSVFTLEPLLKVSFLSPNYKQLITISTELDFDYPTKYIENPEGYSMIDILRLKLKSFPNEKALNTIVSSLSFSDTPNLSNQVNKDVTQLIKIKNIIHESEGYEVGRYFIQKIDHPSQKFPLYIMKQFRNCGRGNNNNRICVYSGFIPNNEGFQSVFNNKNWAFPPYTNVSVREQWREGMPCLVFDNSLTEKSREEACFYNNQYQRKID